MIELITIIVCVFFVYGFVNTLTFEIENQFKRYSSNNIQAGVSAGEELYYLMELNDLVNPTIILAEIITSYILIDTFNINIAFVLISYILFKSWIYLCICLR